MPRTAPADRKDVKAFCLFWLPACLFAQGAPAGPAAPNPAAAPSKPAEPPAPTFGDAIRRQMEAVRIQRETVRKQAEAAAQFRVSSPIDPLIPEAGCDPLPPAEIDPIIDAAAQKNQLQTALVRGVIDQESGGKPCAVSAKGAQGLMQLMPDTVDALGVADAFDPRQNVEAGAKYLKQLLDKFKGDVSLALAAYNAGPNTVDPAKGVPDIPETRNYVDSILKKLPQDAKPPPAGAADRTAGSK